MCDPDDDSVHLRGIAYDMLHRVLERRNPLGGKTEMTYDAAGNMTGASLPNPCIWCESSK